MAALRSVTTSWPQSTASNWAASEAVVPVTATGLASVVPVAVTYRPVAGSFSAIRSAPSRPLTLAEAPSRSRMPSSAVTWYGRSAPYQSE